MTRNGMTASVSLKKQIYKLLHIFSDEVTTDKADLMQDPWQQ